MSLIPIDEVVHLPDITTHDPTTGAITDADSTPTFDVFEEATDTPILSAQNRTKRTGLTGDYRGSFTASAANGFEAGKWYNVVDSATVGGISAKKTSLHFRVAPAEAVAGVPKVDVDDWKGATAPAMTGDAFARLGAPAGASLSADVAAVKVDTAAVKLQTDKLAFTVTNQVDANVLDWKSATAPAMTGDAFARLGSPAGASVSADVAAAKVDTAAIKLKTDNLPSDPADASDVAAAIAALNNLSQANIRTALGLGSANLDTQIAALAAYVDTEVAAILAAVDTEVAAIKAKTDNLPAAPAATGDIPSAASVASAVFNEAMAGHTTAGTYGDKLRRHLTGVSAVVIGAGSTSTSIVLNATTGIDGGAPSSVDDHYNGQILKFTSGTLAGQVTSVSDYVGLTKTLTVVALTSAPSAADQAVLV